MNIIAVDDERRALNSLVKLLHEVEPDADITSFSEPEDAFNYLSAHSVDIALLDIEMGELSGIELARKCRDLCPQLNIIFVTGHSQYTMDALKLHVSGYLMKPVRAQELRMEIDNLRYPLPASIPKRVRIQTFGHFDIFVDNRPLPLPAKKCREALAYLIDRKGARVSYPELSSIMWEDKPYDRSLQNNIHRIVSDLMKALRGANVADIIIKSRSDIAIDTDKVDCDYYATLDGCPIRRDTFTGEYMSQYSWAEFTLAELHSRSFRYHTDL